MNKGRFWSAVGLACVLGLGGFILGGMVPLAEPFTPTLTRIVYAVLGVLISLLIFAPLSSWVVQTASKLLRQLVSNLAAEMIAHLNARTKPGLKIGTLPPMLDLAEPLEEGEAAVLDTSSIIDGRILEVAKLGFLSGLILIPDFVLREIQSVADSADTLKRSRGRRGFEIIGELKKVKGVKLQVWEEKAASPLLGKGVDDKLIALARVLRAKIVTCDFNLNRVARIRGLQVLNVNELANALKTLPIPGEKLTVKILHPGKDKDQGVGYTLDGAMVVVKEGAALIGQEIEAEVTKILQGSSGRIIFGKKVTGD